MRKSLVLLNCFLLMLLHWKLISPVKRLSTQITLMFHRSAIQKPLMKNPKIVSNPCFTCHSLNKEPLHEDYDVPRKL